MSSISEHYSLRPRRKARRVRSRDAQLRHRAGAVDRAGDIPVMGPTNRAPGTPIMGAPGRTEAVMGAADAGPRVSVMGPGDRGLRLDVLGESDLRFVDSLFI